MEQKKRVERTRPEFEPITNHEELWEKYRATVAAASEVLGERDQIDWDVDLIEYSNRLDRYRTLETAVKELQQLCYRLNDYCEYKMDQKLQAEGFQNFRRSDGTLFYRYVESYPSIAKEFEEAFFEWLAEKGEDGIIKRQIHPQTLRGWYKKNSDQYEEEIADREFLKVFEKPKIGVRKG